MKIAIARLIALAVVASSIGSEEEGSVSIRVATYNLRNYLTMDRRVDGSYRPDYPKPEAEKTALRDVIREANADILAVQEIGTLPYLEELRQDLRSEGLDYRHLHHLEAADEERHVAVLSKIPFVEERSVELLFFKYFGEEEAVKRGLIELVFDTNDHRWSLFVVHLKSRYSDRRDDPESEQRRVGEARAVRNHILKRFPAPGESSFLIAGDLNDTRASRTIRSLLKRGKTEISIDVPGFNRWGQTWTYHYEKEELYSRSDYFLASPGMLPSIRTGRAVIIESEASAIASDHRLVKVDLEFHDPVDEETDDGADNVESAEAETEETSAAEIVDPSEEAGQSETVAPQSPSLTSPDAESVSEP
jgi:endonuclease/exonuclease/phosphatase family metal-dependent hydrolase